MDKHIQDEVETVGWGCLWWLAAIFLHVVIIGAIIFWKPLRTWYMSRSDPKETLASLDGDRVRGIVRQIMESHTAQVRESVKRQLGYLRELEDLRQTRYANYVATAQRAKQPPEELSVLGDTGPGLDAALDSLNFFQLYDLARRVEDKTYKTFRQVRVIELARIQSLPFAEADKTTQIATPDRPAWADLGYPVDEERTRARLKAEGKSEDLSRYFNRDIFRQDISSALDGRLKAVKDELGKVRGELASMLSDAARMIDVGKGLEGAEIAGVTILGGGGVFEGAGGGKWGSGVGPSLSPDEFYPGNRDGDFSEDWAPTFGRQLVDDGRQAEWMYIDTWYVIGPFPNPNREYMDKKFPPESVVDLDATYVGKDGLRLKWEWMKNRNLMVAPRIASNYAVWYAYTDIYSDKPQTKWFSFGSDDYSKAWLNGELVWTSGKTPHKWIPDRGFRKLNLRKGHNTLLVKLENAGGTTGYSVVVYTGELNFKPPAKAE